MSIDIKEIMGEHSWIVDIINDPNLTNNAKLFAVCLIVHISEQREQSTAQKRSKRGWLAHVAELAGHEPYWSKMVIADDVPVYEVEPGTGVCVGEMIRREGPCGKRIHQKVVHTNPTTGQQVWRGYCTRHWSLDYQREAQHLRQEWQDNGKPTPGPNHGGAMKRYFHTDWAELYAWAAPYKTPLDGAKEPVLPRPKLTLIRGTGA